MAGPCIIRVAITGSLPRKSDNPAVPLSIAAPIESTQEAFEAGATIAHCHVRDDEGRPRSRPSTCPTSCRRRAWRPTGACRAGFMCSSCSA